MLILLVALGAQAQSFDLYGVGPRSIAMAGTQGSADGEFAATFYNPALLRKGGIGAAYLYSKPSLTITQTTGMGQRLSAQTPTELAQDITSANKLIESIRNRKKKPQTPGVTP